MSKILLCTLTTLVLMCGSALSYEARVLELSDRFLEFRNEGMWLVKFYAPWCGHCKRLEPIFNHVAQALYDSPIRVAKVDCTRFPAVSSAFKISGFPTIMFIRNDVTHVYQGDRKTEDIVQYARRMAGPAVKDLKGSCTDLQCAFKDSSVIFAFVGKQEGPLWEAYNATAYRYQSQNVFYAFNQDEAPVNWMKNNEIPFVAVRKEAEEDFFKIPKLDPFSELPGAGYNLTEVMSAWVERERFPSFVEVSRGNFQTLLDTNKIIVMAVLEQDKLGRITKEMTEFKSMIHSIVLKNKDKYHSNFQFGWVGTPSLANSIAMEALPIPSVIILNSTSFQHHIPDDAPEYLTPEAVEMFLESVSMGTARAYGGRNFGTKLYRAYYEGKTSLEDMWAGNPILTVVIFGLPLAFLSLIFYSICCADFMDAPEEEDEHRARSHEKRD